MKKILFVLFLIASLTQLSAQTKIDTSYDDSLSLAKAPIGSKYIVDVGDYEIYPDLNQIQQISLQESRKDTLAKGQSFRIVDTVRVFRKIAAKIELGNGSLAYIPNMRVIGKYCHKEGESALHSKIWRTLDSGVGSLAYNSQWNLFDQIIISAPLLNKDKKNLSYWKSEVFNKSFLIQQEGSYKGTPMRTHAGGVWLNGYSDHFPTLIYLVKEK